MTVVKFKTGLAVGIKKLKDNGIIVAKADQYPNHWIVAMRKKEIDNTVICIINEKEIQSYKDICWKCHSKVNSESDNTCHTCGWVMCSNCGSCRQSGCFPSGVEIHNSQYSLKYKKRPRVQYVDLDLEFDDLEDVEVTIE